MLERLRKGGLPHDDAFINDDDEHVITDSDDDDAFIIMMMSTSLPTLVMMMHLLMMMMSTSLPIVILRYSNFYVVLCMIYIFGMYNFITLYDCFLYIVPWS